MDDILRTIATDHGAFLRSDIIGLGLDDKTIQARLKRGEWVRVRHGAYVFADSWRPASLPDRHRLLTRSVARVLDGNAVPSHQSALLQLGYDPWGLDLRQVQVTSTDGRGSRREAGVHHHRGLFIEDDLVRLDGLLMTNPTRTVLDAAAWTTAEAGLALMDWAAHQKLTSGEELVSRYLAMRHWPFTLKLELVLRLLDGRAESVGESRSRYLFWRQGLPAPDLQFTVLDEYGDLVGTTDFAWPRHRLLGEFDGKQKYGRLLRPGEKPEDAVFREKRREDRLREVTDWGMVRLTWADLSQPGLTAERVRRKLRRTA